MYSHLIWLNVKARLQYGRSFIYETLTSMIGYMFEFIAVWIIISMFKTIGGWNFYEILFLHALGYFVRALASAFLWEPMGRMGEYIQNGLMDRYFVFPTNPFLFLIGRHFLVFALSHVILGGAVVIVTLFFIPIQWTLIKVLLFLCAIAGGLMIYGSFILLAGAIAFWTVRSYYILRVIGGSFWNIINYPISIYPRAIQLILTFFIPLALMNYYPVLFLTGRENINGIIMLGILLVGGVMLSFTYMLWMLGAKRYQGAGG